MRYKLDHKSRTKQRILAMAAQSFNADGYAATGVAKVMQACGLTVGGFYAHFANKEGLLAEVLAHRLDRTRKNLLAGLDTFQGVPWVREFMRRYLSRSHRDDPASGCVLPALSAEVARQDSCTRDVFEEHLHQIIAEVSDKIPPGPHPQMSAEDRALATIALGAGALLLSRAVNDQVLADRILMAARRMATSDEESE